MKIDFNKNNDILTVSLDGRLDTTTAPILESFLVENFNGTGSLVIDCEKLLYVSSAGLRVLLATQKKAKNSMKLVNVCEFVMEVFTMTGFADILTIE
jgi:anti-sigma B factor antagonist